MRKNKVAVGLLLVFALTVMISSTAMAFVNKDFYFDFYSCSVGSLRSEPNEKQDTEERAYVTTTGGSICSYLPVEFSVCLTNGGRVTKNLSIDSNNLQTTIMYTVGPVKGSWYQLNGFSDTYVVDVRGRWCP